MIAPWRRTRDDPLRRSWRDCEFVVVDVETTGLDLDTDTLVAYGAALVRDGRISPETAYGLVRPESPLSPEAIAIHTLRAADLADAPPSAAAVEVLDRWMQRRVVVAHCAWVERAFLTRAFRAAGHTFDPPMVDTAALARACGLVEPGRRSDPGLEWLATRLGLPVVDPHHALGDALTTAQVFLVLASRLVPRGYETTRGLVDLTVGDRRYRWA